MDGWKYTAKCGRKESGFENLKTRFQDCNLSRKQESKPDGMIERKQSFNRESKLSAKKASCLCGMNENKEVNPEKPDVPLNKNDAFQKVQKRRVQEKR